MRLKYPFFTYLFFMCGCTKFVQVDPPKTQLINSVVYNNDASATSAVTGIYATMMSNTGFASMNTTYYAGMSADEMIDYSNLPENAQISNNSIDPVNSNILAYWGNAYQYIYGANALIEGLQASSGVSPDLKKQLIGEAKFIRAFCHFYLVNLFGDIPLVTSSSYQTNAVLARTAASGVYDQIVRDLQDAQLSLPVDFAAANGERTRPISAAAMALLARVFLYNGIWDAAEKWSTSVISDSNRFQLVNNPDSVFLANSSESIWQLQPVVPDNNTWEGYFFILNSNPAGASYGVALNDLLVQAFDVSDLRLSHWTGSFTDLNSNQTFFFPFKYKVKSASGITEYYTVIRLAELYLIRAEARARQNNLIGALSDLNRIRSRAGLSNSIAGDQNSLLQAIGQERRFELFAEWGNRWLDLKRASQATAILSASKPGWQATDTLYPIPATERQNDPSLTQNPGYH